jgi:hypothetical protein
MKRVGYCGHAYWWVIWEAEGPLSGADIARRAVLHIPVATARRIYDIEHSRVGRDTLRDLRLYGLIGSDGYRDDVWATHWAMTEAVRHDVALSTTSPAGPLPIVGRDGSR